VSRAFGLIVVAFGGACAQASLETRRCAVSVFPCSYPGCSEAFPTKTQQRIHKIVSHPARQTQRDLLNLQKYVKRFLWTGTGGKPFGQGPMSSYRTAWCGNAATEAALARPAQPPTLRFTCPHPHCDYIACSSTDLIHHHYDSHSTAPSSKPADAFVGMAADEAITVV